MKIWTVDFWIEGSKLLYMIYNVIFISLEKKTCELLFLMVVWEQDFSQAWQERCFWKTRHLLYTVMMVSKSVEGWHIKG